MTFCKKIAVTALLLLVILSLFSCAGNETHTLNFIDNQTVYHTAEVSRKAPLEMPKEPINTGYTFEGWYFDKDEWTLPLTVEYLDENPLTEDTSVYAKWTPKEYTVTFAADGRTVDTQTYTVENRDLGSIPEVPKKEGFFAYWEDFELSLGDVTVNAIYKDKATVKIKFTMNGALNVTGRIRQTVYPSDPSISNVIVSAKTGYKYLYYEVNGEKFTSSTISLDNVTRDTEIIVYADYFTDELPVINIDTDGASITSKTDYVNMTFTMTKSESDLSEVTGGIRLRGNSTSGFPKKPYRIKFDKKQSLFGLDAAKSWVLLAEYLDPSALNNYTALTLANEMPGMKFNATPHKVNLYLNGEYQGLYTLCEQIQENDGRVGIEMDAITPEMTKITDYNFLICMDRSVTGDEDAIEGETYFTIPIPEYNNKQDEQRIMFIEVKYPEKEDFPSEEQFYDFMSQLEAYMVGMLNTLASENAEAIKKTVNVNSLIDYLIIDQIMNEDDHTFKSFYMYYTNTSDNPEENGKLSFGPVWDYDYSMGVPWQGYPNQHFKMSDRVYYSNIFFTSIINVPEFYETVKERYKTYAVPALEKYIEEYSSLVSSMRESVALNQKLWYDDIDPNLSKRNQFFVEQCLEHRLALLKELWE